jgi:hypothetical protein
MNALTYGNARWWQPAGVNAANRAETMPKKDSKVAAPRKNTMQTREARVASVIETLQKLARDELVDVLLKVFDQLRLDDAGNPTDPPGLYAAATTSMIELVEPGSLEGDDARLATNLAAVGRGVRPRSSTKDDAPAIREIAGLLDAMMSTTKFGVAEKTQMLARTLEKRFGKPVDRNQLGRALANDNRIGRVTDVAIAAHAVAKISRRKIRDRVRTALR